VFIVLDRIQALYDWAVEMRKSAEEEMHESIPSSVKWEGAYAMFMYYKGHISALDEVLRVYKTETKAG
jgi:hypothetical protein